MDPPRGRPVGGGGTSLSWGCGGDSPNPLDPFRKPGNSYGHPHFSLKTSGRERTIPEKYRAASEDLQKSSIRLSNFLKKVRQGYRTFQKLSGNIITLFQISSPKLPDFLKNIRQRYRFFWKKCEPKTHLRMPDPIRDFPGLSKKYPARLSDLFKIVRQSYRTF